MSIGSICISNRPKQAEREINKWAAYKKPTLCCAWTTFQCQLFLVHQLSLSTVSCQLHYCCCIWAMLMPHFRLYCAGEQLNNVRNLLLFLLVRHCVYFPLSPPQPHSMHIIIEPPIRVETECSSTRNLPYFALLWLSCCYCPLCVCLCVWE